MKRTLVLVAAVALLSHIGNVVLDACGAKFLVATRSPMFQKLKRSTHPMNILVFQHNQDKGVIEFMSALRGSLTGMGHRVTVAVGEAGLRDAASGKFDLVMMHLDEARRLKGTVTSTIPAAAILPMKEFPTSPDRADARAEFGRMLVLPAKESDVFSTIEAAGK